MKKIVIILALNCLYLYVSFGQTPPCEAIILNDIYTPLGNQVNALMYDCDYDEGTKLAMDNDYANKYPNAIQMPTYDGYSSTLKFNCHGYAWGRVEHGIDRWMPFFFYNYMLPYFVDNSYIEVSSETFPAKVFWDYPEDHSAITTEQPGWFISKWANGPLCYHRWDDCPYHHAGQTFKYYVINCHPLIEDQTISLDRNIISCGTLTVQDVIISSEVTVNMHAQDEVVLKPGSHAVAGSNVSITAGGRMQTSSSPSFSPPCNNNGNANTNSLFEELLEELSVETLEINEVDFSIFPNPNDGNFVVKIIGEILPYTVEIFNNLGGQLGFVNCNEDMVSINRTDLNPGIYYIRLTMKGKMTVKKIIVR